MQYIEYCKQLFHSVIQIPDFAGMTGFGAFSPFSDRRVRGIMGDSLFGFCLCYCSQLIKPYTKN